MHNNHELQEHALTRKQHNFCEDFLLTLDLYKVAKTINFSSLEIIKKIIVVNNCSYY